MARRRARRSRQHRLAQPLDRLALIAIASLTLALGLLMLTGDHATARVRDFTWQDRQVGAEDRAFLITFSRPMDGASVEKNLKLDPPLPGKVSWAGRRMAYTPSDPLPYGESFTLSLDGARDRYAAQSDRPSRFEPFQAQFQTRQRAFLYIGAEGDEANRLVLADLARQQRTILTPKNLSVMAFKSYPLGDKVLFSASDTSQPAGLLNQQLYSVTTGLTPRPPVDFMADPLPLWRRLLPEGPPPASGETTLVLDDRDYQNLKFDLSRDGKIIVVQRVNRQNPADFGPWLLRAGEPPKPIETEPGGDFLIAPDSQSLLLLQGQGTAIIDLGAELVNGLHKPLDFLPEYGQVLDMAADGSAAAMVNFNQDDPAKRYTESLFWVTNQGREEELLQVSGAILEAQFDPTQKLLYVLATELVKAPANSETLQPDDAYAEQPLLLAVTLADGAVSPLLRLPLQHEIHMSVAPDGRSLLLDLADQTAAAKGPKIWRLPLVNRPAGADSAKTTAAALAAREGIDSPDSLAQAPDSASDQAPDPASDQTLDKSPALASDQAADALAAAPAVIDPEPFPFRGIQATWLP
ncbi:Ig-like domain-containing protein [Nodosilinea nodulosa]|uniref:Ig-like domain-containing protein n=1 Tax=Nodosilinea nodulosa TaxID=416001 RepID=UPI0002D736FB|nr:Ig-like domain-containing protein [Nodosilinea nodulosa]